MCCPWELEPGPLQKTHVSLVAGERMLHISILPRSSIHLPLISSITYIKELNPKSAVNIMEGQVQV